MAAPSQLSAVREGEVMLVLFRNTGIMTRMATLLGGIVFCIAPAIAGSDNSSRTYSGDYAGGSLPTGTFVAFQYLGYVHADAFIDLTGQKLQDSHANVFYEFTRFAYISEFAGKPLVFEADIPVGGLTGVNIPGTNNLVASGLSDPLLHLTYFFIADAKVQRWLGLTNFFYLPIGRSFDNQKAVNVSTPRQFTDVTQIGYTEGLEKFSPALKGVFFDLIANASFHTNGASPVAAINPNGASNPGFLYYDTLVQRPSYDVSAYLRYAKPDSLFFIALGIEKSWGGKQIATGGRFVSAELPFVTPKADLPLHKDELLRGHIQFQIPLAKDVAIAADVFHDFYSVGGFRNNFGVELRFAKLFSP